MHCPHPAVAEVERGVDVAVAPAEQKRGKNLARFNHRLARLPMEVEVNAGSSRFDTRKLPVRY